MRGIGILVAAGLAASAAGGAALAQGAGARDVCAGFATQAEEIACLRGALEESRSALSRSRGAATPEAPPPRSAGAAPVPAPTPRATPAEQLGAEQVPARHREPKVREARAPKPAAQRVQARVAGVETDPLGLVTLRLDNGQVWRQAESAGTPLLLADGRAYAVEIAKSGFGGYRMRFPDIGRQIVVTRVQ